MHPVSYDAAYEVERNRLTTFFRLIVVIPWYLWASLYSIAAQVVALIAWFAMLFTKRYPEGMYNFIAGYLRLQTRVLSYALLLTDELPSFSGKPEPDYPVKVDVAPPQQEYSRAKTGFKLLLYTPQYLIISGLGGVLGVAAMITWFRVMFTGKQSITMQDALRVSAAYAARSTGFLLMLTEVHPRLLDLPPQQVPADAPALPSPQQAPQGTPAIAGTPATSA